MTFLSQTAQALQQEQGWSDSSIGLFALRFIEQNGFSYSFDRYLQNVAALENEETRSEDEDESQS